MRIIKNGSGSKGAASSRNAVMTLGDGVRSPMVLLGSNLMRLRLTSLKAWIWHKNQQINLSSIITRVYWRWQIRLQRQQERAPRKSVHIIVLLTIRQRVAPSPSASFKPKLLRQRGQRLAAKIPLVRSNTWQRAQLCHPTNFNSCLQQRLHHANHNSVSQTFFQHLAT